MADPARKQPPRLVATYADLVALPDHVVGEIIDGVLHTQPRPAARHATSETAVSADLHHTFGKRKPGGGGPGGWIILAEPELHLDDDVLVPDIAGWKRTRMAEVPDTAYLDLAPDWVCEIVSPRTARKDRILKVPKYAAHGVPWLWLVDPVERTVEALERREGGHWLLHGTFGGNATSAIPPFDAVAFDLREWWGGPEQPDDEPIGLR